MFRFTEKMFQTVVQLDYKTDTLKIIKSEIEDLWLANSMTMSEARSFIIANMFATDDDRARIAEFWDLDNLKQKFGFGVDEVSIDYEANSGGNFEWHTLHVIKSDESMLRYSAYVCSINSLKNEPVSPADNLTGALKFAPTTAAAEKYLYEAKANGTAVLFAAVDLDDLRGINHKNGKEYGDLLLALIAHRFAALLGDSGVVCRAGGDEFLIVRPLQNDAESKLFLDKIADVFRCPFGTGNSLMYLSACIGGAVYPSGGDTAAETYNSAFCALSEAKSLGYGRVVMLSDRVSVRNELKKWNGVSEVENSEITFHRRVFRILYTAENKTDALCFVLSAIGEYFGLSRAYILPPKKFGKPPICWSDNETNTLDDGIVGDIYAQSARIYADKRGVTESGKFMFGVSPDLPLLVFESDTGDAFVNPTDSFADLAAILTAYTI
ncbi:MAG: GGDEF domain-containing protein [Oscillospiraceae bacterium]|jgi:diguanylate cyclase (GGDEF)-like protein|nr:GGDEF domain-containing protein [Oscillospiraceae bacterium]